MVKKHTSFKNEIKKEKRNIKNHKNRKIIIFKKNSSVHTKLNDLSFKIKVYKEPNEYSKEDQKQKIIKFIKQQPTKYFNFNLK